MQSTYSEKKIGNHVVGVERLEKLRWRVSVDGRRLFTFCSESRARERPPVPGVFTETSDSLGPTHYSPALLALH